MRKLKNKELNRLNLEEFKNKKKVPIIIVLDNVRSAHNVGSVFRTSDAFLIEKIILCGICPTPPNKDIRKTALGASESVEWEYRKNSVDAVRALKKEGYSITSIEQADQSTTLKNYSVDSNKRLALVFGNEVDGVNDDIITISNEVIEIPQHGTKHSFNVSVSAGIVLWDLVSKMS
ncbi:RNA methyltransferase [Flavobacteriales bacterium]|nr:RNA methyltransferase [Flavobacteriales bacterium]